MESGSSMESKDGRVVEQLLKPLIIAASIVFVLFGQFLLGPPNIHSARTLVMLVECLVLLWWLTHHPLGLLWTSSRLYRVIAVVWIGVGLVGAFFATHNGASALVSHLEWVSHLLFLVALCDYFYRGLLSPTHILKGIAIAGFVSGMYLLWQWITLEDPKNYYWTWGVAPFLNIRHLAFLLLPAFLSGLCVLLSERSRWAWFYFLCAFTSLTVLIWSGGRAALVAGFFASGFAILYYTLMTDSKKWWPILMFAAVCGLSFATAQVFETNDPSLQLDLSAESAKADDMDRFSSGRLTTWLSLIDDLSVKDLMIGQGVDNYKYVPGRLDSTVHPHSWPLQALAAWGLVGLTVITIGVFAAVGGLLVGVTRSIRQYKATYHLPLLCVLSASLALSLLDGNFYHSWSVFVNVLIFAAVIFVTRTSSRAEGELSTDDSKIGSGWLYGVCFLFIGTLYQLVNNAIVFGGTIPKPKSWQAEWVIAVPFNTVFMDQWLEAWKTYSGEDTLLLLKWLQSNSPTSYRYYILEAQFLVDAGYPDAAQRLYEKAIEVAPNDARQRLIKKGPPSDAGTPQISD